jgi:tetratricopeptide (TPR) repeat protein
MKIRFFIPFVLISSFFLVFLLITPLGVFNDWIPPSLHTGNYSITNIDAGDDYGYYVYLRSIFFDGDIDFSNEKFYIHIEGFTETGYVFNNWQIGLSVLFFPFFLIGHMWAITLNALNYSVSLDGYSFPYLMSTALASQTYLFLGILLVYQINRKFFSQGVALFSALLTWLASPMIYYSFIRQRMAHTAEFFMAALFIWVWIENRDSSDKWKHAMLGSILGFLGVIRITALGVGILYLVDQLWKIIKKNEKKFSFENFSHFIIFWFLTFSLQFLTWYKIEGYPLPVYNLKFNKGYSGGFSLERIFDNLVNFFIGFQWGIIWSSPIIIIGVMGLIWGRNLISFRVPMVMSILAYFFLIIYVLTTLASYQYRYLFPIYPLISLGLCIILNEAFKKRSLQILAFTSAFVFVVAQYFFLIQYKVIIPFSDSEFSIKALSNIPTILASQPELLLRSSNFFKLLSLDLKFDWGYKEFSYFVFYPLLQLTFTILSYKVFYRIRNYFEKVKGEKSKAVCILGVVIILILNIVLIYSGPEKSKTEIEARQNYLKFKKQALEAEKNGNKREVITLLKKAVNAVPELWIAKFNLALFLNANGNIEEANNYYRQVLDLNSQHQTSKYNLAKNFAKTGKLNRAETLLRSAIKDNPLNPKPYQSLAQLLVRQKKVEEAERFFNRAISLDPDYEIAYLNFATLLTSLNRYEEAERLFNQAILLNPKLGTAHLNYGILLASLNRYEEAERSFNQAILLNQKFGAAHLSLSILLTNLKRYDEAISHLKKAFDEGVESPAMGSLMKFYGIQVYQVKKK